MDDVEHLGHRARRAQPRPERLEHAAAGALVDHRALADHQHAAGLELAPVQRALGVGGARRELLAAHDRALAALGAALGEIDVEIVVAERDLVVRRRQRAEPQRHAAAIGVNQQIAAVGEAHRQRADLVELGEPAHQHVELDLTEVAPAALDEAVEQAAEDRLGVGRADRLERTGDLGGFAIEAAGVRHDPVAPAPGPRERLGVRVRQRPPRGVADVQHEHARCDLLPRQRELTPDRGLWRRGFLEDRRRRLALGVVAEAPAVGQCASWLETAQRE
jgi:hypothetical protein